MSTYEEATSYIENIPRFAPKTGLDNTRGFLKLLGNPEKNYRSVHVAGTNGKGSVSKMIALMLEKSGYRVGLFTSPHLIRMNERISINGEDISDDNLVELYNKIKTLVDAESDEENGKPLQHPAYFEYLFLMAALYFSDQKCDYVVFETGLGGRLDATNVITPEVSVITSIGLDHMQYLGDTIEDIAGEKAGIIKPGIPVVTNTGSDEADAVIKRVAEDTGADLIKVTYEEGSELTSLFSKAFDSAQPLYQYDNAATATATYMVITGSFSYQEKVDEILEALKAFSWPGRCEYLAENVLIDGAHNVDAAEKLVESIQSIMKKDGWRDVSLLFAVSSDKDYEGIIKILTENLDIEDVYVTEINSIRKQDIRTIMSLFQKYIPKDKAENVYGSTDMIKMFELARNELAEGTLLLCVGSLYMVGEILDYITKY